MGACFTLGGDERVNELAAVGVVFHVLSFPFSLCFPSQSIEAGKQVCRRLTQL
jgi:hypothetical protein